MCSYRAEDLRPVPLPTAVLWAMEFGEEEMNLLIGATGTKHRTASVASSLNMTDHGT